MVESLIDPLLDKIYSAPFEVRVRRSIEPAHPLIPKYSEEPEAAANLDPRALQALISSLQSQVAVLNTMIDGANIVSVCNSDGTITTTLTWGS